MINKFYISDAKVLDDRQGIVEAYVNTMGIRDADGDIIDPAAFDASIRSNLPIPVLAGHDPSKLVGKVIFAQPEKTGVGDEHRLYARIQMTNIDVGHVEKQLIFQIMSKTVPCDAVLLGRQRTCRQNQKHPPNPSFGILRCEKPLQKPRQILR